MAAIWIQQEAVLLVHTSNVKAAGIPDHMLKQKGQRAVHPAAKQCVDHHLAAPGMVGKMFHYNGPIVREPAC